NPTMSRPPADDWAEDQTPREVHAEDLLGEPDPAAAHPAAAQPGARHDERHPETHLAETYHDELFPEDHDESLAHDVLQGPPEHDEDLRPRRAQKHHNPLLRIVAIVVAAAIVIVGGIVGFNAVRGMIPDLT